MGPTLDRISPPNTCTPWRVDTGFILAPFRFGRTLKDFLPLGEQEVVKFWTRELLKENRYDPRTRTLRVPARRRTVLSKADKPWTGYFVHPASNGGLKAKYIQDPVELRQLTAFFAWTAWASVARRPGRSYSYTNNFPYDPWWATPRRPRSISGVP